VWRGNALSGEMARQGYRPLIRERYRANPYLTSMERLDMKSMKWMKSTIHAKRSTDSANEAWLVEGLPSPRCRQWVRLAAIAIVIWIVGCHYSTERPFRTDIQTVHVEMFHTRDFRRELEFRLTESIIKRIEMDTPYRIASRGTADAILVGEIIAVENATFWDDFDSGLPREIGSTVVVRYQLKDMRTGEILVDRPRFVYQASYIPPVGETFTTGMVRAMDGLAEQIVESMETTW
jgi:hypothetical protein